MNGRGVRWLWVYEAVVYGLGMVLAAGLISAWGQWYSQSKHHRAQVEALLRGELALSKNPADLAHDLCWSEGGVHQVWGLGVPLWRLPFEAATRLAGTEGFPDMLALAAALGLAAWAVLRALFGRLAQAPKPHASPHVGGNDSQAGRGGAVAEPPPHSALSGGGGAGLDSGSVALSRGGAEALHAERRANATTVVWLSGAAALVLVFPPFVNLLQTRFDIYEEVIAYEYLVGLGLLAGLIALVQRPSSGRYWGLCALAGLGGLVRPTLVFHGAAVSHRYPAIGTDRVAVIGRAGLVASVSWRPAPAWHCWGHSAS